MSPRWLNLLVVAFWLATMTWLVVVKIVPTLLLGEPPSYKKLVAEADHSPPPPVAWDIYWDDEPIGKADSQTIRQSDGMTDIESHVHIEELPLAELAPPGVSQILRLLDEDDVILNVKAESIFSIDPLGNLASFRSVLGTMETPKLVTMQGVVDSGHMKVTVRSGGTVHSTEMFVPGNVLVGDALSPRDRLPDLHAGQTWTVPVYSPFQPTDSPMEILRAEVEPLRLIEHDGEMVAVWLVVYRADGDGRSRQSQTPRGQVWVRRDGMVLKQEMTLYSHRLAFVRVERVAVEEAVEAATDDEAP